MSASVGFTVEDGGLDGSGAGPYARTRGAVQVARASLNQTLQNIAEEDKSRVMQSKRAKHMQSKHTCTAHMHCWILLLMDALHAHIHAHTHGKCGNADMETPNTMSQRRPQTALPR